MADESGKKELALFSMRKVKGVLAKEEPPSKPAEEAQEKESTPEERMGEKLKQPVKRKKMESKQRPLQQKKTLFDLAGLEIMVAGFALFFFLGSLTYIEIYSKTDLATQFMTYVVIAIICLAVACFAIFRIIKKASAGSTKNI